MTMTEFVELHEYLARLREEASKALKKKPTARSRMGMSESPTTSYKP